MSDVFVVIGLPLNNRAEDNDRVVAIPGYLLRNEGRLEGAFHIDHGNAVGACFSEKRKGPVQETVGDRSVEQGTYHADTKICRVDIPAESFGHGVEPIWPSFVSFVRR